MVRGIDIALQDLVQQVGVVRRWLVVTALLKSAALALGFVVAYVILFTLLDTWCHFQSTPGRPACFDRRRRPG